MENTENKHLKVSVVICTYNRKDTLEHVLPTLIAQSVPSDEYEILVCDAGSSDGSVEYVNEMSALHPQVRLLPGENTGRSGARNRGVQNARGELILFTDADILADPNLIAEHLSFHSQHPGNAVVGCEVQVKSLAEYEQCRLNPGAYARHKATRRTLPWHYFLTGNASCRRDILLEVGCFDEGFQGYGCEDLELGYRLLKKGLTIYYNPNAIDYHWHPVPFEENIKKHRLNGHSVVRFYRKHKDWRIALQMGLNPFALLIHTLVPEKSFLMRLIKKMAPESAWARTFLLQWYQTQGMKEALRHKG